MLCSPLLCELCPPSESEDNKQHAKRPYQAGRILCLAEAVEADTFRRRKPTAEQSITKASPRGLSAMGEEKER